MKRFDYYIISEYSNFEKNRGNFIYFSLINRIKDNGKFTNIHLWMFEA